MMKCWGWRRKLCPHTLAITLYLGSATGTNSASLQLTSQATAVQGTTVRPKPESAVTVKQPVTAGHIVCLDCGKHFSMLKRHLMTDHKLGIGTEEDRTEGCS